MKKTRHQLLTISPDEITKDALVVGCEMLNQHKGHARIRIGRHAGEEGLEGSQPTRRGAYADNRELFLAVSGLGSTCDPGTCSPLCIALLCIRLPHGWLLCAHRRWPGSSRVSAPLRRTPFWLGLPPPSGTRGTASPVDCTEEPSAANEREYMVPNQLVRPSLRCAPSGLTRRAQKTRSIDVHVCILCQHVAVVNRILTYLSRFCQPQPG